MNPQTINLSVDRVLLAALSGGWSIAITAAQSSHDLSEALAQEDLAAVWAAVATGRRALGPKAGEPEVADTFLPISQASRWLTATEARRGFKPDFGKFEKLPGWRIGLEPAKLTQALRGPAAFAAGNFEVTRTKLDGADPSRAHGMAVGKGLSA